MGDLVVLGVECGANGARMADASEASGYSNLFNDIVATD